MLERVIVEFHDNSHKDRPIALAALKSYKVFPVGEDTLIVHMEGDADVVEKEMTQFLKTAGVGQCCVFLADDL